MFTKEPVWMYPKELMEKYYDVCQINAIDVKFINHLANAHFLVGKCNLRIRMFEILEESFLKLILHIGYNRNRANLEYINDFAKISVPEYCKFETIIYNNLKTDWYEASDLLLHIPSLKYDKTFDIEFINELARKNILMCRYTDGEKNPKILIHSFIEMLKYRNYIFEESKLSLNVQLEHFAKQDAIQADILKSDLISDKEKKKKK